LIYQVGKSILFLAALTLPVWVATRFAINVYKRRRNQQTSITRELLLASLFLYLVFLAAVTVVPLPMSRFRTPSSEDINLIPILHSAKCLTQKQTDVPESVRFCLENILGNIALFLPLGVILPLVSEKVSSIRRVLVLALVISLAIEVMQLLSRHFGSFRSVDIDDILLNTFGACLGYICFAVARQLAYANR
jgi:glycopeptide antibiotics resistance protein